MFVIKNEDVVSAHLLSVEEAENVPEWIRACGKWWWLRSHGFGTFFAASVRYDGSVDNYGIGIHDDSIEVRPAIIARNLPLLEIGETIKVFGQMAQYVGNNKVLLCESIFKSRFDEINNNYKTSEVKQRLDEWFNQMKSEVNKNVRL